jgi:endonuclease III
VTHRDVNDRRARHPERPRAPRKASAPAGRLTLPAAVERLRRHYGPPASPPTDDPFELILLENVAYLAPLSRRHEAFAELRKTVGTSPAAILGATKKELEKVTARGILKATFAVKLRECARIAVDTFDGDLRPVIRGPVDRATRALRAFPGIGEPGAERILMLTGRQALLAPESNGLRVLVRLGLVEEAASYVKTYAASREAAKSLRADPDVMREAHLLLRQHGQTLCKRAAPRCKTCPLADGCAFAQREEARAG